jgi:hypothetical protein
MKENVNKHQLAAKSVSSLLFDVLRLAHEFLTLLLTKFSAV